VGLLKEREKISEEDQKRKDRLRNLYACSFSLATFFSRAERDSIKEVLGRRLFKLLDQKRENLHKKRNITESALKFILKINFNSKA